MSSGTLRSSRARGRRPGRAPDPEEHVLLEAVIASSLVLVFRMDPADMSLSYVSPNVEHLLGYAPDDVIGVPRWWVDRLHPDEATEIASRLATDLGSGVRGGEHEFRFRHADGSWRWFDAAVSIDRSSARPAVVGYAVDVTDRKLAEEALRANARRFQALIDNSHDAIALLAPDAALDYVSPSIEAVFGYPAADVLGTDGFGFVHPDDLPNVLDAFRRVLATPRASESAEYRVRHADGSWRWVEGTATNLLDDDDVRAVVVNARDVTDRHRAESDLHEAEEKYRSLVERIPAIVYVADFGREAEWRYVSPRIEAILGCTAEEWLDDRTAWYRHIHPQDRDRALEDEQRARDTLSPMVSEYRMHTHDGRVVFIRDEADVLLDADGRPTGLRGAMHDITDRREAEEALRASEAAVRESEERHRLVIDTSPDAIAVNQDGRFVFVNPAAVRLLGARSADELLGRPAMDVVHPDFRDLVAARISRMLGDGTPAPLIEERFVRLDGTELDVEVVAAPLTFGGRPAVLVVVRDIGERKRIQRALVEAEAKYRALVEQLPAVVYLGEYGETGDWLYISPQLESVLGYTPAEWLAHPHPMASFTHPDDLVAFRDAEERSLRTGGELSAEARMLRKDGEWIWVLLQAAPVRDTSGEPILLQGVMYDVTDRKRVEERLRASEELVRRLFGRLVEAQEEERARIASDLHDDSIQAVTAVGLRLHALGRTLIDPAAAEAVRKLEAAVESAIARMRHLLFELRPRTLDADGLAATLRVYLDQMAAQTGIEYQVVNRLLDEPPTNVRLQLYRIAQEALANVRKHASAGRVEVTLEPREGGYFVRVRDDGRGFDANDESRPGHLGISSMRERAEMAGGRVRIESSAGSGCSVEFWLPSAADGS